MCIGEGRPVRVRMLSIGAVIACAGSGSSGQEVWSEGFIEFEKRSGGNWMLPENQDQVTELVRLTRKSFEGLFNVAQEVDWVLNSPKDTEWSYGSAENWEELEFTTWLSWHGSCPACAIGKPAVVHLITDDIYIDIEMISWGCCGNGGFKYTRATKPACAADANGDGKLNVLDFLAFQELFVDGDPRADCDRSGSLNVLDFLCFQGAFQDGCE